MAIPVKKYRIHKNRLLRAEREGFLPAAGWSLSLNPLYGSHTLNPERIDSAVEGCIWGRMVIDAKLPENSALIVRFYASDEECPVPAQSARVINKLDLLLYQQKGRYLWIWIEILGGGEGSLNGIEVYTPGDTFLNTFPEIYKEQKGFFRRYLSVFSSIYMDFQQQIDTLHQYVDVETAPASMLSVLAEWMGLQVDDTILDESIMRELLRSAAWLNRYKGTRTAVQKIADIIMDEEVIILERNTLNVSRFVEDQEIFDRLYGSGVYDVTILIRDSYDEKKRSQLLFVLNQFKPVKTRVNLVFLKERGVLDRYSYMDINAALYKSQEGKLDYGIPMDGSSRITDREQSGSDEKKRGRAE